MIVDVAAYLIEGMSRAREINALLARIRSAGFSLCERLVIIHAGCGPAAGYVNGVKFGYPEVATRLDGYGRADQAANLRAAAVDPVTYPVASAAWDAAAPVYRADVSADAKLAAHRKQDWLDT